ncbi:MAG: hypothetical protein ACE5FB_01010 [Candidatus Binatia bacterium]
MVYSLGGELAIAKDQIESIVRVGEGEGKVPPDAKESPGEAVGTRQEEEKVAAPGRSGEGEVKEQKEKPVDIQEKAKTPEELLKERRAKEEKEYQKRVEELTRRIKALNDRYSLATKGKTGTEPTILESKEQIQARTADIMSRLRDEQYNPGGSNNPGDVGVVTGGTFGGDKTKALRRGVVRPRVRSPLPAYSAKEKKLSKLRAQMTALKKERDKLIQEMRAKNFDTGFLFLQ